MPNVVMGQPQLVYAAPVNENTAHWGVYSLPKIWRMPDGELVIRFNGIQDRTDIKRCCPDLFFFSRDEGRTWDGPQERDDIDLRILGNVEFPFFRYEDGRTLCIRPYKPRETVDSLQPVKRFPIPNAPEDQYYIYRQSDLKESHFALERVLYDARGNEIACNPACFDFGERELFYIGYVNGRDTHNLLTFHTCAGSPFLSSIHRLADGTLIALATGQNAQTHDHFCGEAYLMESTDEGFSWRKRSVITANAARYPYGLCGDGQEASLSVGSDGTIYCATRTNMSIDHLKEQVTMQTMLFISRDDGYSWSQERPVAENSITPHVIALKNGLVALIYGRPGVHIRVSEDGGNTFSEPYGVIGTTLMEELAAGKGLSEASRFDISYSNTFYVMLNEDTFLLLYTDLSYDTGDGEKHKAGLLRRITIRP